jgi:hypothetical protein
VFEWGPQPKPGHGPKAKPGPTPDSKRAQPAPAVSTAEETPEEGEKS